MRYVYDCRKESGPFIFVGSEWMCKVFLKIAYYYGLSGHWEYGDWSMFRGK